MRKAILSSTAALMLLMGQAHAVWQQPPHSFAPDTGNSMDIGSDAFGNAIVVDDDDPDNVVNAYHYSRLTNTWSGPIPLGVATGSTLVSLDVDSTGTALAIWSTNSISELHSSYFNGTVWTPGSPDPFGAPSTSFSIPIVDMNGPTTALAVWRDVTTQDIYSSFFSAGTWTTATVAAPSDGNQLSMAYSANGTAVIGYNDSSNAIIVSNYIGGVWQAPVTLDPSTPFANHNVRVGIDASGNALAIWVNNAGDVQASSFTAGSWQAPVTISTSTGNDPFSTALAMNASGQAVAAWINVAGVGFSNSYNGTSWGTQLQFASSTTYPEMTGDYVSINSAGNALIMISPVGTNELYSAKLPLGGVWSAPAFIADTDPLQLVLFIPSLSDSGFGFAGFAPGIENLTYFASVEIVTFPPLPPATITGSVCKNRFATQTDRINTITWTASPTPGVIAYIVRRDGVIVAEVLPTDPFIFIDHNRCKGVPTTYTVTAVIVPGIESAPVTIVVQ